MRPSFEVRVPRYPAIEVTLKHQESLAAAVALNRQMRGSCGEALPRHDPPDDETLRFPIPMNVSVTAYDGGSNENAAKTLLAEGAGNGRPAMLRPSDAHRRLRADPPDETLSGFAPGGALAFDQKRKDFDLTVHVVRGYCPRFFYTRTRRSAGSPPFPAPRLPRRLRARPISQASAP
jgi:hypothetical protein